MFRSLMRDLRKGSAWSESPVPPLAGARRMTFLGRKGAGKVI